MTWTAWEVIANLMATVSVILAARNNVHLWWTGIIGSAVFCWVFTDANLYADATLQVFFIVTSVIGWRAWLRDQNGQPTPLPVTRTPVRLLAAMIVAAVPAVLGYAYLLHRYTNAYAPFIDAFVLGASVVATYLLMYRRVETWPVWLLVNTVSVPLFWSRGLQLTAITYALYWCNAWHGWWKWRQEVEQPTRIGRPVQQPSA
jgi:nicotinamide mononucleotide transporter